MRVAEMSVAVWFLAWAHGATLIRSERIRPGQRSSNDTPRNYSAAKVSNLASNSPAKLLSARNATANWARWRVRLR